MKLGLVSLNKENIPQLGLGSIATYIEKELGMSKIRLFDTNHEDVPKEILNYKPDVLGISAMTFEYGRAIALAKKIKEKLDIPIMIGGTHISTLPKSMNDCFDIAVIGEAEQTMLELVKAYEKEGQFTNLQKINGVQFFDKGKIVMTEKRSLIENLDDLPIIDMKYFNKRFFKKSKLHYTTATCNKVETYMLTSRGCPYRCSFCSTALFWEKIRFNSAKHIIEQIKHLVEYKADHIEIWDDLFSVNKKRLEELIQLKKEEGIPKDITFSCQPRANLINEDMCKILKKLNIKTVTFGFESGCEKTLKFLKGGSVTVQDNRNAIKIAKKFGFRVYGSLIFAVPEESLSDMKETVNFIRFAKKHGADQIRPFVLLPLPGTRVWEIAKEKGLIKEDEINWEEFGHNDFLSDYSMEHPMMLDPGIKSQDFLKVFDEARAITKSLRWKLFFDYFRNNPLAIAQNVATSPLYYIKKAIRKSYDD